MKPIDLYDAMEGIPDQYIEAAKPAVKRHGESRTVTTQTVRAAEQEHSSPRTQKRQNRKDSIHMSTIQPVWQRITTGLVAAAACAVFVGGGWFIVQQARQNRQQETEDSTANSLPNFLGGRGTIHVASDMYLMYDNEKAYFSLAQYEAKRGNSEVGKLTERETAAEYLWDGEQFYHAEDNALYRIGTDGKHLDSTPFYTIDIDEIQKQVSTDIVSTYFLETKKLADGYYYVCFAIGTATDKTVNWDNKVFACIYQPENGQQDFIPNGTISQPHLATDGTDIILSELNGDLYRIQLNPVRIESLGNVQPAANFYSNYTVSDGSLYYMASKAEDECETLSYGRIDLKTLQYTDVLETPDFTNFVPYDGKIYALSSDGSKLISADPDMKHVKTVCDFNGMLSKMQQAALDEDMEKHSYLPELRAVDDNWFMIALSSIDAARGRALIDRKTMKVQLFTENGTDDINQTAAVPNIYGGTGALHTAGNMWLIYDDNNVYFEYSALCGERNPASLISGTVLSNAAKNIALVYDGKYLYNYTRDNFSLYRLGSDGNPEATPFFTVSDADIETFKTETGGKAYMLCFDVNRLTEQYYHVFAQLADDPIGQNISYTHTFGYLYNAETGACQEIPDFGEPLSSFRTVSSGDYFYCCPVGTDSLYRFDLEHYTYEEVAKPEPYIMWNECILVENNALYYLSPGLNSNGEQAFYDFAKPYYCKYDLSTGTSGILSETPDLDYFVPFDGMIYFVSLDGKKVYCADPELKNKTLLIDYERDIPAELKEAVLAAEKKYNTTAPIPRVDSVDENYLCTRLEDGTDILLDRKTGTLRFYRRTDTEDMEQSVSTMLTTTAESAAATTTTASVTDNEENVFCGWGRLYPVDWDNHGAVALYRDSINYYFFDEKEKQWYSCPLAGGEKEPLPARIMGAQAPHYPFISDGERVYTKGMLVYSDGYAANSFDTAQIRAYLEELNDDATDNGYYYDCQNIWHIRNRYFLHVTGTNEKGDIISIEVWTDETGRIISHENAPADISLYFSNGTKTEMQAIKDGYLHVIDCPGDPVEEKPDPLAYGKIIDIYSDMEHEYYYTTQHKLYTRVQGQPVLVSDRALLNPKLEIAPDGRFFYVNQDPLNYSLREWIGGSQDNELYAPELCQELWICGFEQTGNGKYNIILSRTEGTDTGYIFVDAATGQAVKKIQ